MDFIKDTLKKATKNKGKVNMGEELGVGFLDDNFEMMLAMIVKEIDLATKILETLASSDGLHKLGLPDPLKEFPLDKSMLKGMAVSILKSSHKMMESIDKNFGRDLDEVKVKEVAEMDLPKPDLSNFKPKFKGMEQLDHLLDKVKDAQENAIARRHKKDKPN